VTAAQNQAAAAVTRTAGQYAAAQQHATAATTQGRAAVVRSNASLLQAQTIYGRLTQALQGAGGGLGAFGANNGRAVAGMLRMLGASNSLAMVLGSIPGIVATVLPALVALGALLVGFKVASWGVALAAEAETAQTAFSVFLGSAKKGAELASELRTLAAKTPLTESEVFGATKLLLAFGVAQDEVNDTLRRLGDISSGIGQPLTEIADLYGRMRVQGRLFAVDINQLTNRGIPVIEGLAAKFHVTKEAVRGLVEQGKVSFSDLEIVIRNMTSEGGKFYGMMDALSKTLNGKLSTLYDTFAALGREIGDVFLPAVKYAVDVAISGLTAMTDWLRTAKSGWTENRGAIVAVGEAVVALTALYAGLRLAALAYTQVQIAQLVGTRAMLLGNIALLRSALLTVVGSVVAAAGAAFAALAAAVGPVIAAVAVLVGLGYAAYKAWQWLFGKKIEPITISIQQDGNVDVGQLDALAASDMGEKGMASLRKRFGTTNAGLRQMAVEGKLSGAAVTEALQQGAEVAGDFKVSIDEATKAITLQEGKTVANMGAIAQAGRVAKALEEEKKAMALAEAKRQEEEMARVEKINTLRREGVESANEAIYPSQLEMYGLMRGLDSEQMANLRTVADLKRKNHLTDDDAALSNLRTTLEATRLFTLLMKRREEAVKEFQEAQQKADTVEKEAVEKRKKDAAALVEAHRTSGEKFREGHQRLSDMLRRGDIGIGTYVRAMRQLRKDAEKDIVVEAKLEGMDAFLTNSIKFKDMMYNMRIGRGVKLAGPERPVPGPLAATLEAPAAPIRNGVAAFDALGRLAAGANQPAPPTANGVAAAPGIAGGPLVSLLQQIERNTREPESGARLVSSGEVAP
jgi:tape measure domain-containing protein